MNYFANLLPNAGEKRYTWMEAMMEWVTFSFAK